MRGTPGLPPSTMVDAILKNLDQYHAEKIFVFLNGDGQEDTLTLGELDQRARAVAAKLQEHCVPGDRSLLLYPSGIEFASAFFGCLYAGVIAVCAYPPRNNRNLGRLSAIINDCQPKVVMASEEVRSKAEPLFQAEAELAKIAWVTSTSASSELVNAWKMPILAPEKTCFLQYTSGSTGNPKGVMVSGENLFHNTKLMTESFAHTDQTVFVSWLPLFHDMGLIGNLLPAVYLARPMIFMPPAAFLQKPIRWLEAITRYGGTVSMAPNFAYDLCVERIKPEHMAGLDLSTWELAINAAEPVRPDTMENFCRAFAPAGFRAKTMSPGYGLAEATLTVTNNAKTDDPILLAVDGTALADNRVVTTQSDEPGSRVLASSGKGWFGQRVEIVDPATQTILGHNEIGEIWIQGSSVALGYWQNEEATRNTFQAYTDTGEGPFLKTGDLGFVGDQEEIYITGRHKDVVIIRGRNHYPQDIEHTVTSCHPSLAPGCSAAFAIETEDREALVIFQEVKRTWLRKLDVQEVIAAIHAEVAKEHDLVPHAVCLLRPGRIPKTSSGKIQRSACRKMFLSDGLETVGSHVRTDSSSDAAYVDLDLEQLMGLPEDARPGAMELWLQSMVAETLQMELSLLDMQKPLSSYGVDSLAITQIMARINDATGQAPSWEQMFNAPNLAALSSWLLTAIQEGGHRPAPLPRQADDAPIQLSFPQERMWLLDRLNLDGTAYNVPFAWKLEGELNLEALKTALDLIKKRHEPLTTAVMNDQGTPRAVIHDAENMSGLLLEDLSDLSGEEAEAKLASLLEEECAHRFDLSRGEAIRTHLYRLAPMTHVLLIHMHHIACDGWSIGILRDELSLAYDAILENRPVPLESLEIRYRDYAAWQRNSFDEARHGRDLDWWTQHLKGVPALELPTDKPRQSVLGQNAGTIRFTIDREQRVALKHLASERKATLYMTLLAGFQIMLWRYSGQTDFAVGVPVANRNRTELEALIGFFVNTLAPRADLSGNPTFGTLLERVRQRSLGALAHGDMPFEQVVQAIGGKRDLSRSPIFQAMFTLQQAELDSPPRLKNLVTRRHPLPNVAAQFDLSLDLIESDGRLTGELVYHEDLFSKPTAETMIDVFKHVLGQIPQKADSAIAEFSLLSDGMKHTVLESFGRGPQLTYETTNVLALFFQQAQRSPDAEAVIFGETRLSYGELADMVSHFQDQLINHGAACEQRVAVFLDRCIELPAVLLAVMASGAAYVPVDPTYPAERIQTMLHDAAVSHVVTNSALAESLPHFDGPLLQIDKISFSDKKIFTNLPEIRPDQAAYMIFTSGSTGRPKGVVIEHDAFTKYTIDTARQLSLGPGDRILQFASLSFDVTVAEFFPVLTCGGAVVLPEQPKHWSYQDFSDFVTEHRITGFELPTHYWAEWTDHLTRTQTRLPMSLRFVMAGTERIAPETINQWRRLGVPFIHVFGLTETTVTSLTYRLPLQGEDIPSGFNLPVGKPNSNTRVFILNNDLGLMPPAVPGRIYLGGDSLARGYHQQPARTAERFIPNPFADNPGERLYDTGDLGQFGHDGLVTFLGRRDHQIKIRGFRIEPGEIESRLTEHPSIAQALVVAKADASGEKRLLAYWIPAADEAQTDSRALVAFLKDQLPAHMIPQSFISLNEFPVTSNGKIDLNALPTNEESTHTLDEENQPGNALESQIGQIWQEVLGLDRLGVNDHFFEVGGSSSMLIRVHGLLNDHFPDLKMVDLFQYPTIAALADHLKNQSNTISDETTTRHRNTDEAIAVVGMAARYPGSKDINRFWENLCKGYEAISFFDDQDLESEGVDEATLNHPAYVKAKGVLEEGDCFDGEFFGYSPRDAELMDPQHRVFLELAWTAMEHAGYAPRSAPGRVGTFAGAGRNSYLLYNLASNLEGLNDAEAISMDIGNSGDFLTTRVAHKLNFTGPALNLQTACSTSLVAVVEAVQALLANNCDMALAGGVTVGSPRREGYFYQEGGILSPDGHCRPFDAKAAGTVPGEGAGVVVLKRLDDAKRDGDTIYGVIRGAAINNDGGAKVGFTAPGIEGQTRVIAEAHDRAGIDPREVTYMEAHGTGTALGDPVEIAALSQAFARKTQDRGFCAIGSVKSNLGHADAAAGIAGLIKAVLALHHGQLPPMPHFEEANPNLDLEKTPFYIPKGLHDWQSDGPRCAGVSSFGIGGTNAHVVLEQAEVEVEAEKEATEKPRLFVLSAHSLNALDQLSSDMADALNGLSQSKIDAVVSTLIHGREHLRHRRAVIAPTLEYAVTRLRKAQPGSQAQGTATEKPTLMFLFPGQGSHYNDVARSLYHSAESFRKAVDECAEILRTELNLDIPLHFLNEESSTLAAEQLYQSHVTQAVLFTIEYALAQYWLDCGLKPEVLIGKGIGEFVAACLAGVFSLRDALHLVAIHECLETQYTAMVETAEEAFSSEFNKINMQAAQRPVLSSSTGQLLTDEQACDPEYWVDCLRDSASFETSLNWIEEKHGGDNHLVLLEVGPGRTLTTLAGKRLPHTIRIASMGDTKGDPLGSAAALSVLGHLWATGIPLNWDAIEPTAPQRIALPTYPFERQRYWREAVAPPASQPLKSTSLAKDSDPQNWFYLPSWQRTIAAPASDERLTWLVLGHDDAFTDQVVTNLNSHYQQLVRVHLANDLDLSSPVLGMDPGNAEHFQALLQHLDIQGLWPDRILHLWSLNQDNTQDFERSQEQGLYALLRLIESVNSLGFEPPQLVMATRDLQHPRTNSSAPYQATLNGLIRVLSQEMPRWQCRAVDLSGALDKTNALLLSEEVLSESTTPLVGWYGGNRWVEDYSQLKATPKQVLREGGVYLITGGMGWIGLLLAEYLMDTYGAKVALLSRSALPASDQWASILENGEGDERLRVRIERLQRWQNQGWQPLLLSADVADASALETAIADTEKTLGDINGVFHAAGLTDDRYYRPLLEGGVTACTQHFQSKVHGLHALEKTLGNRQLDFCMLFSSVASVLGGLGYLGYAAANAYLDAWCLNKQARGDQRWLSVAWDGWLLGADSQDVTPGSPASFAMTDAEGLEAIERALHYLGSGQVIVSTGSLDLRRAQWSPEKDAGDAPSQGKRHQRPQLSTAYQEPRDPLEEQLCELWQEMLGLESVGVHDHFFDLGGDSLMAVQLASRLWEQFALEISSAEVLEWPTVAEMSEGLLARLSEEEALEASI